jgi:hypothetical protein
MGPDFGLSILLPALLLSVVTVLQSAKQEHQLGERQRAQSQAISSSKPI